MKAFWVGVALIVLAGCLGEFSHSQDHGGAVFLGASGALMVLLVGAYAVRSDD